MEGHVRTALTTQAWKARTFLVTPVSQFTYSIVDGRVLSGLKPCLEGAFECEFEDHLITIT